MPWEPQEEGWARIHKNVKLVMCAHPHGASAHSYLFGTEKQASDKYGRHQQFGWWLRLGEWVSFLKKTGE